MISEFGEQVEMFVHTDGSYPVSCAVVFNKDGKAEWPSSIEQNKNGQLENIMKDERYGMAEIKNDIIPWLKINL